MTVIKLILGFLALCWLGFVAFLFFWQDKLLYQPPQPDAMAESQLMDSIKGLQAIQVTTPDGYSLSGWYLPRRQGRGTAPVLVYYGGNAEDAGDFMKQAANFPSVSLAAINYRGYGRSMGAPSEQALMDDSLAVYDQVTAMAGGQGYVMGRSLGAGLAVHVAANRPVLGEILVTPYDSLLAVAREHYPFAPVKWLLRETWDVRDDASRVQAPSLVMVGTDDGVISPARGQALYDALGGSKQYVEVPMAGHNDIDSFRMYQDALRRFFDERGQ